LFHRIDDSLPEDPITCSRKTFAAFCDFYRRFFVVVSLSELLRRLRCGEDISRHLVITFDDGYEDNARVAAHELRGRDLPACFFVATGFVGTDRQAPWDEESGVRSRWMTWSDVRRLAAEGFEVGAHTINHVDLGVVSDEVAEQEIGGSRDRLEQELSTRVQLFSYPFGRAENITAAHRDRVRRAGFLCCASAFGGVVSPSSNPFELRRIPISRWFKSPYQFGVELMLLRKGSRRGAVRGRS
ncbi:MAG TPA: polysaccharide deacetylase family protein, partial [Gemmatimonadales bacterium]|nr:polysaccharide deacetylase family protein [Gemmatimonadales bacterium]